jgi:hypothetical protein
MWLSTKRAGALVFAAGLAWGNAAKAEVKLAEAGGWVATTDGRVNAFVSHIWGDNRPAGLESLGWVGFNESGSASHPDAEGKLRKTRIRSGYVPSTLALNLKRQVSEAFKLSTRVEIGFQIANINPTDVANPTWMDPRAVYLDVAGNWGSVRAGRDFGLFSRGNLFMNYELGHAYGVGFPCSYELIYGGACGHVGFGTLWPDFHAQLVYSTPNFADIFQVSLGIFDPRTIKTAEWVQTPLPRFEGEAVAKYNWREGWGFKAWVNGFHQIVGMSADIKDPMTQAVLDREDFKQSAYGAGGGAIAYLGALKAGFAGYTGKGMDAFEVLTFNPILVGQGGSVANKDRRFRPSRGILAEASVTIGKTWVMGGFGKAFLDRVSTDNPIEQVDAFPLLRSQTGISAGVFHRIDNLVLGIDYFNAHYGFDARNIGQPDGSTRYVNVSQTVNVINAGMTVEW